MLLLSSQIINLPVGSLESQSKVGVIRSIVFDPQNGKVLAFLVQTGGLLSANRALSTIDVAEIDKQGLVIKSQEELVPIEEIIRLKDVLKRKIPILGQVAKTESGRGLGRISDVLIDCQTMAIVKYYLKGLFVGERILPAENVVEIKKEGVIFQEDIEPSAAEVTA